ncbi:serine/arginine-rich splicing factor 2-like isoform X1 [Lytechinus pictus]|uniref:serine/arginine-rich splicing factor 2-like isoform X1 n=1 Tax=Lytechinus pictus TaxID=7653 RepID=UPI00240D72D1|nr:serine/arginine-rich splicing factor 2-like isoform X1 [Lytechinus pictus]XP_054762536.1 serine/arginine-rich splicing factor 2-like isoform X1 [Lytechinus pictus]
MSHGSRMPPDIEGMTSLKVDNLTYRTSPEELRRCFERYGDVGDIYIPRDKFSRESRGFAFVRYLDKRDAEDAMDSMDGNLFDGRKLRVQMARYGRPHESRGRYGGGGRRDHGDRFGGRYGGRRRSRSRSRGRYRSRSRSPRRRKRSYSRSRSRSRSLSRSPSPRRGRSRSHSRSRSPRNSHSNSPPMRRDRDDSRSRSRSPDEEE